MTASGAVPVPTPDELFASIDAARARRSTAADVVSALVIAGIMTAVVWLPRRIREWAELHPGSLTAKPRTFAQDVMIVVMLVVGLAYRAFMRSGERRTAAATGAACPTCGEVLTLVTSTRRATSPRPVVLVRDRSGTVVIVRCPRCNGILARAPEVAPERARPRGATLPSPTELRARIDAATEEEAPAKRRRMATVFGGFALIVFFVMPTLWNLARHGGLDWLVPHEYGWMLDFALFGSVLLGSALILIIQTRRDRAVWARHGAACPRCGAPLQYRPGPFRTLRYGRAQDGGVVVSCAGCGTSVAAAVA